MTAVSSTSAQLLSQTQSSNDPLQTLLKKLEKEIESGVQGGTLTQDQASALDKQLQTIEQQLQSANANGGLSSKDMRQIRHELLAMLKTFSQDLQSNASAATSSNATTATDTDGDNDGSTGVNILA